MTPSTTPDSPTTLSAPPRLVHHDVVQGSPEWLCARLGRVTSSGAVNVLPMSELFPKEGKAGRDNEKGREGYVLRLAIERITGLPAGDSFTNDAMDRGTELEPQALERYRIEHSGYDVRTVGFLAHEDRLIGDSPDGLVYEGEGIIGGVEVKCPGPVVHMKYRETGGVPGEYLRQMLHHLYAVPAAQWWDFVSYHPSFPGRLAFFEYRMERAAVQPLLDIYAAAVVRFLALVDAREAQFRLEM